MPNSTEPIRGVIAPLLTPFGDDLSVATDLFVAHAMRMMEEGCAGLAPFGTTGEALSIMRDERIAALWALKEAGIDPARMIPGTGLCSYGQTAELSRACLDLGCAGVMVLPPFYYKTVTDSGLYEFYARLIEAGGDDLRIYLYHIPHVTGIGLSIGLVRKLRADFPRQIVGIKDSSGDWENTRALMEIDGLAVYPGSELRLLDGMDGGAQGCITATANLNAQAIVEMLAAHRAGNGSDADLLMHSVAEVRAVAQRTGFIEAPKAYLASETGDARWANVRPPLVRGHLASVRDLREALQESR